MRHDEPVRQLTWLGVLERREIRQHLQANLLALFRMKLSRHHVLVADHGAEGCSVSRFRGNDLWGSRYDVVRVHEVEM